VTEEGFFGWATERDNGITLTSPTGHEMSLRVVWNKQTRYDVAYVCPTDDDNGNFVARTIAAAPMLLMAVKTASLVIRKPKCADSETFLNWANLASGVLIGNVPQKRWITLGSADAWTAEDGGMGDRRCVRIHTESSHELRAHECRSLAEFLVRASEWIDEAV